MQILTCTEKEIGGVAHKCCAENDPDDEYFADRRVSAQPATAHLDDIEDEVSKTFRPLVFSSQNGNTDKEKWNTARARDPTGEACCEHKKEADDDGNRPTYASRDAEPASFHSFHCFHYTSGDDITRVNTV